MRTVIEEIPRQISPDGLWKWDAPEAEDLERAERQRLLMEAYFRQEEASTRPEPPPSTER